MTVTIHLPVDLAGSKAVLRRLVDLAGGDRTAVRSGNTGLVVSDDLALAYLSDQQPTVCCAAASHPVPPNLARVVREAEAHGGLLQPPDVAPAEEQAPTKTPRTTARRPRRTQGAAV